jgi:hypothetical protein
MGHWLPKIQFRVRNTRFWLVMRLDGLQFSIGTIGAYLFYQLSFPHNEVETARNTNK